MSQVVCTVDGMAWEGAACLVSARRWLSAPAACVCVCVSAGVWGLEVSSIPSGN